MNADPELIKPAMPPVSFNEDILILPDQPVAEFNKASISVYEAQAEGRGPTNLLAYICAPGLTPRISTASNYAAITNPHAQRLVAGKVIAWGDDVMTRRFCLVYEHPGSAALMDNEAPLKAGWKPDTAINGIVKPIVGVFYDLQNTEMFHGSIRPHNMYGTLNGNSLEKFVLGDCVAIPPGYDQPVLYETIERAMAQASGRGPGTVREDLYALGVTLAVLLRHTDPMEGASDDEIIRTKHEQGSFNALFGKENLSGHHIDLLRGLLQDDPALRWTVGDIESWLEGRRQSPKSGSRKKKAGRPLVVNEEKYYTPEMLAYDMDRHPADMVRQIDNGEFDQWLTRALEDTQTDGRVAKLRESVEEFGQKDTRDRRLLACMSMALHPAAPVRYEGLRIMPMGFGAAFSEAAARKGNIRAFLDLIQTRLVVNWLEVQEIGTIDISSIFSRFDSCRTYLGQTPAGFGFERCVYTMDEDCPCLSEKILSYQAYSPEDLLFALEALVQSGSKPLRLFDRHSIAFLLSRDRKNIEPYLSDLNSGNDERRLFGELRTLATVQKRTRSATVPNLGQWFVEQKAAFLSRIHDRQLREKISNELHAAAGSGNLDRILNAVDNPRMRRADMVGFQQAMHEYRVSGLEAARLRDDLANNPGFGRGAGRSAAAALSSLIAFLIIALTIFNYFASNQPSSSVF